MIGPPAPTCYLYLLTPPYLWIALNPSIALAQYSGESNVFDLRPNSIQTSYMKGESNVFSLAGPVLTISVIDPSIAGITADYSCPIRWTASAPDNNARISLYYDTNNHGLDGTPIIQGLSESNCASYVWNLSSVPAGQYYIYAKIEDGQFSPAYSYSQGTVTVKPDEQVVLTPTQTYNPATKRLDMRVGAQDLIYGPVGSGTQTWMTWQAFDSAGTSKGNGILSYDTTSGDWLANYTFGTALANDHYTIQYVMKTDRGRTGSAVVQLYLDGSYALSGMVRNGQTQAILSGVTIVVAGQTVQTDSTGAYSFAAINPAFGSILTASKTGFATYNGDLALPSGGKALIRDISLFPLNGSNPVVTSVDGTYKSVSAEGLFISGWSLPIEYTAKVDWQGRTPGTLDFYANQMLIGSATATSSGGTQTVDMGQVFEGSLVAGANQIRVIARANDGAASIAYSKPVSVLSLPPALSPYMNLSQTLAGLGDVDLALDYSFPDPGLKQVITLPLFGKYGFEFAANASFDYTLTNGDWEAEFGVGAEGKQGKRGRRPLIPALTRYPKLKLYVGNKEINGELKAGMHGIATPSTGIRFEELSGEASIGGKYELTRFSPLDLLAPSITMDLSLIPGLNEILKDISILISASPEASGDINFSLDPEFKFKNMEFKGDMPIEAAYEPDLGICNMSFYAGGKPGFTCQIPGDLLKELRFKAYAGAEFEAWLITLGPYEYVFIDVTYPEETGFSRTALNQTKAQSHVIKIPVRQAFGGRPHPMSRDYLSHGLPRFVANRRDPKTGESPLDRFRSIGRKKGRVTAGLSRQSVTQADLTLLENVFPRSNPALASRNNELMLLCVSDNGLTSGELKRTDVNWMRFDGSNWSVAAPILADTRGEFAPTAAYDGNGDVVALWERVKDPNFDESDIRAMAAQMEIVGSRWNHSKGEWSTPAPLTNNDHLDHMPLICGPMSDGSLLAVWTENQANLLRGEGADGSTSNSRVLWTRWDPSVHSWTALQTLVDHLPYRTSQSLAGNGSKAIYTWTRDMDGLTSTTADQELFTCQWDGSTWGVANQLTSDTLCDTSAKAQISSTGDIYIIWQRGSDLVMDRNLALQPWPIRLDSLTAGFADYSLTIGPNGNLVILWHEVGKDGPDARYSVYDPASRSWSNDERLFSDPRLARSFAPAWDSAGNLTVAYNQSIIQLTTKTLALETGSVVQVPNVPEVTTVTLAVIKRTLIKDIGIQAGDFGADANSYFAWKPSDDLGVCPQLW